METPCCRCPRGVCQRTPQDFGARHVKDEEWGLRYYDGGMQCFHFLHAPATHTFGPGVATFE
jgi:hypothetical protein